MTRVSDPGTRWEVADPARLATMIRLRALRMVAPHGFGYLGQALSSAEQVAALFTVMRPGRDRLICSPSHYVIGFIAAAAELGILGEDEAHTYGQDGSPVEAIGTERSPVMDYTCGSLGQGLSEGAAMECPFFAIMELTVRWLSMRLITARSGWACKDCGDFVPVFGVPVFGVKLPTIIRLR